MKLTHTTAYVLAMASSGCVGHNPDVLSTAGMNEINLGQRVDPKKAEKIVEELTTQQRADIRRAISALQHSVVADECLIILDQIERVIQQEDPMEALEDLGHQLTTLGNKQTTNFEGRAVVRSMKRLIDIVQNGGMATVREIPAGTALPDNLVPLDPASIGNPGISMPPDMPIDHGFEPSGERPRFYYYKLPTPESIPKLEETPHTPVPPTEKDPSDGGPGDDATLQVA